MLHYNLEGDRVRARSSAGTLGDKLLCLPDRDLGQERRDSIEQLRGPWQEGER